MKWIKDRFGIYIFVFLGLLIVITVSVIFILTNQTKVEAEQQTSSAQADDRSSTESELPINQDTVNFLIEDILEINQLTLDAAGKNDDKLYAARYHLENNDISFVLVQVTLATGNTMAVKFDGIHFFDLSIGDLMHTGRDCIVLQLTNISSTYAATDIHVLEVFDPGNGIPELVERFTVLDGYNGMDAAYPDAEASKIALYQRTVFRIPNPKFKEDTGEEYFSTIISGGGIVDIDNKKYLRIYARYHGEDINQDIYADILWDGNSWGILGYDKAFYDMQD